MGDVGNWFCGTCQFIIYGHKDVCRKCGSRRPTVAAVPVVSTRASQGVVKAGDWPCAACGVNNFASRGACFKCKAVKPRAAGDAGTIVTEGAGDCCVCMTAKAKIAIIPCGHLCLCAPCGQTFPAAAPCPLCRGPKNGMQTIFQ